MLQDSGVINCTNFAFFLQDVVECWHWLLSACPRQELVFLQEMISAWHHTRFAKLGLFSDDTQSEQVEQQTLTPVIVSVYDEF